MNPLDQRWAMVRDRWPIRVKNSSGSTIPPFSVVLASTPTFTNNELVIPVVQPNAASTDFNWDQYLVTGPFAIGSGSSNEGLATTLKEPGPVRYDSGTPAAKEVWGPKHGQLTLSKGYYGFEVLGGTTSGAGNNVTVARWVGVDSILGRTDSSVTGGNTVTVSVWSGTTAGSESDTTMNVTSCYLRNGYVPTTTFVHVIRQNGLPYIQGDHRQLIGKAASTISKGSSGTVSIYNNESDTTDNVTAKALGAQVTGSKWASVWQEEKSGNWYVAPWECS